MTQKIIDLRSDTVTKPTARMRAAMAEAEVGDDVFGEDPTVRALEEESAGLLGKEEGMFVASGTMANQIAVLSLCSRGQAAIVLEHSHLQRMERAGAAALMGVPFLPIATGSGVFNGAQLEASLSPVHPIQMPKLGLLCLENTYDLNRGLVVSPAEIDAMSVLGRQHHVPTFLDGARIFNAAVALGVPAATLTRSVDAAQFCLAKGLSSPVGSVLVGSRDFIAEARWMKQQLGGGWRQAGVIAAAGLVALKEMIPRLAEDHARARQLGLMLADVGLKVDESQIQTNIIRVELGPFGLDAETFVRRMAALGVLVKPIGPETVRMVLHREIEQGDLAAVVDAAAACSSD
ncbi:GntG family PLP-dependent aldolase [Arthrobacter sp. NicSoilB8]|uniref:GntG family PLP-dependent aldolase n=1 Tax=Arthrobacter sp. NicSoilB8 TaxID=2830998 RepID=UPI001CC3B516|nr:GntG family PLP-dependent aldolase [Arthrobacter sp. NicSoilB8]BCW73503.1 threonine aldolase [Arthrobacter sp. NicSoilB8]BCW73565.1 threonine aldolase [Arthrobacter sp. NicSoilB8]